MPEGVRTATMAVTIDAPPGAVWPWLVQMGTDRGGWYSWDLLDNFGRRSADRIHPGGRRSTWVTGSSANRTAASPGRWPRSNRSGSWRSACRSTCGAGSSIPRATAASLHGLDLGFPAHRSCREGGPVSS